MTELYRLETQSTLPVHDLLHMLNTQSAKAIYYIKQGIVRAPQEREELLVQQNPGAKLFNEYWAPSLGNVLITPANSILLTYLEEEKAIQVAKNIQHHINNKALAHKPAYLDAFIDVLIEGKNDNLISEFIISYRELNLKLNYR